MVGYCLLYYYANSLAIILTIGFRCIIDDDLASVLTTVFAFVFTVLFGFAAILVGKIGEQ